LRTFVILYHCCQPSQWACIKIGSAARRMLFDAVAYCYRAVGLGSMVSEPQLDAERASIEFRSVPQRDSVEKSGKSLSADAHALRERLMRCGPLKTGDAN
jgi:hypothetical protein